MSLQPLIPYLVSGLAASVAMMVWAAAGNQQALSAIAAGLFSLAVVAASLGINWPLLARTAPLDDDTPIHASRRNARLMALAYAWGAAAMLAVYFLSGLWWWHSWQYGSLMAFVAAALIAYVHRVGEPESHLRSPRMLALLALATALQGFAAVVGLALLVHSGKPWLGRADWAANHIFLAGGTALAILSAIAVVTHIRIVTAAPAVQEQSPVSGL